MKIDYREARALLRQGRGGALGTCSVALPGYPFVSAVRFVTDEAGWPLFLISTLAEHTRNLLADPRASLLVTDGEGVDIARARLTVLGRAEPIALNPAQIARFVRYEPDAAHYLQLGDFRFFRLLPERARFVGGFGRMGWLEATAPTAVLAPNDEARIVDVLARQAPPGVTVLGLDEEGLDVRVAGVFRRLAIEPSGVAGLQDAAARALQGLAPPAEAGDTGFA